MKKSNFKVVKIDKNKGLFNYEKKILIKELTLEYNRGRQAAITRELIEITSGAEAL